MVITCVVDRVMRYEKTRESGAKWAKLVARCAQESPRCLQDGQLSQFVLILERFLSNFESFLMSFLRVSGK